MARKKSPTLTDAELRLMDILWEKGSGSVSDLVAALPESQPLAYNTVLTTLRILEQKQYVDHIKEGRAHVFKPLVDQDQARNNVVRYMVSRFFNNSPELLAQHIIESDDINPADLDKIKRLIEGEN
jgi:BlaI family transcriptional regulator, penicillinase repressor